MLYKKQSEELFKQAHMLEDAANSLWHQAEDIRWIAIRVLHEENKVKDLYEYKPIDLLNEEYQ